LADLGVRAGDVIDYYASATDSRPDAPQTAATEAFRISIISEDQFRELMQHETTASDLKDKYGAIQEQIESLTAEQQRILEQTQDLAQKLARGGPRSESDTERLRQLSQQQADIGERAQNLMKKLRKQAQSPPVFDIEKEYKKSLQQMADRLERALELMGASNQKMVQAADAPSSTETSQHMADAARQQQQALEQLGRNLEQFDEQIAQANETLERAYKLMQDVETFKAIYQAQSALERQARSYKDVDTPTLDEQVRMKELSEAQGELRDALLEMRDSFREHAAEIEAELPEAAEDARGIAEELDARRVASLMEQAITELSGGDGAQGHAKAGEAKAQLEEMMEFAQQASGSASQGAMRLKIVMGIDPGNTMSQLGAGMRPSFTPGQMPGVSGQGAGGMAGSNMAFDVFGSDMQGDATGQPSAVATRRQHDSKGAPATPEPLAGSFEELPEYSDRGLDIQGQAGERFIEDYRGLIEAYFRRMAEEQ
jgi:chromosome segregation ATPase